MMWQPPELQELMKQLMEDDLSRYMGIRKGYCPIYATKRMKEWMLRSLRATAPTKVTISCLVSGHEPVFKSGTYFLKEGAESQAGWTLKHDGKCIRQGFSQFIPKRPMVIPW